MSSVGCLLRKPGIASVVFALAVGLATPALAASNLLYILDASNSMWGKVGAKSKIETAKRILQESLANLPKGVSPALMLYGHRRKDDCSDVELVVPFGQATPGALQAMISGITPKGKTPIATALQAAADAFAGREEENNAILLISDGIETCNRNPCAVARSLAQRGINLKVNVVGFDVDKKARAQLQCIAAAGDGQYFDARNASDFKVALKSVAETVTTPPPAPVAKPAPAPPPVAKGPKLYFMDSFDGNALLPVWQLRNPNSDNMLVENSALILVSHDGIAANFAAAQNILRLKKPVPKGNWTITARLLIEPQTMGEAFSLGLLKDAGNGILASISMRTDSYARTNVNLSTNKSANGKRTGFSQNVYFIESRNLQARAAAFNKNIKAVELRLEKRGRKYTGFLRLEPLNPGAKAAPDGKWKKTQSLSSLKLPGDGFALIFGGKSNSYTPDNGEGVVRIDWVKIEVPR